ncbi:hypothetical protein KL86DPRO_10141 [uncultured delta proteobacterium]|uniref:Uncharacterized protein n=1 Tax=uncultured delta proteobacterium TaxID=34034 RepID=A0A212IVA8_9DELT|nr:hypothetical protein KL86DPRO_10141 [uncultured delta proteobacterium]
MIYSAAARFPLPGHFARAGILHGVSLPTLRIRIKDLIQRPVLLCTHVRPSGSPVRRPPCPGNGRKR